METNEIMENEEVIETTEEIVKAGSGKGLKIAAGVGLAVLVGGVLCKYVVIPAVVKYKARKQEQQMFDTAEADYSKEKIVENIGEKNI